MWFVGGDWSLLLMVDFGSNLRCFVRFNWGGIFSWAIC